MKKSILFSFIIFFPFNLLAKETLKIEEAISIALNSNPEVMKFNEKVKEAEGRRMQLEAYPNHEIVFSREGLNGKINGESETIFGIFQNIEFLGKRGIRKSMGEIEEEIAKMELEKVKRVVISKVKKAYFKAVFAKERIMILQDIKEILDDYIEGATLKYQAGEIPFSEVLRGRVERLKLKNEILEGEKELREKITELGNLLGKKFLEEIDLSSPLQFQPFEKSLEKLIEECNSLPVLKIEELKLKLSNKGTQLSEKSFYPDLRIGFFYPSLRRGAWGFEFGLSIPLFQKGLKGAILKAKSKKSEDQISFESKKREISSLLESLYFSLKNSEEIIRNYEISIFPELKDLFSSALSNYQSGIISSLEFFDILRMFKTAKIEYKREILNYINIVSTIESAGEEE